MASLNISLRTIIMLSSTNTLTRGALEKLSILNDPSLTSLFKKYRKLLLNPFKTTTICQGKESSQRKCIQPSREKLGNTKTQLLKGIPFRCRSEKTPLSELPPTLMEAIIVANECE